MPYRQRLSSTVLVSDSKAGRSLHLLHRGLPHSRGSRGHDLPVALILCSPRYQSPEPEARPSLHTLPISGVPLVWWLAGPSFAHLHVAAAPQDDNSRVLSWGVFMQVLELCPLKTPTLCNALVAEMVLYEVEGGELSHTEGFDF